MNNEKIIINGIDVEDRLIGSIIRELMNRAMPLEMAEDLMKQIIENNVIPSMDGGRRWFEKSSDYPPMLQTTLFLCVKEEARKYLEEKHPQAFFLPLFDDKKFKELEKEYNERNKL